MRIVVILATYNEERFIRACLEHYLAHGLEVFVLDNESTDRTMEIVAEYQGRNVIGADTLPRKGVFSLNEQLLKKEQIADRVDADWLMHADPDEFRVPPRTDVTLAEAIAEVDAEGYNAVNFMEYTFLPVRESPDHDHADFQRTMRWYYPYGPKHPHRLNAWKRQPRRWGGLRSTLSELRHHRRLLPPSIDLRSSGGHVVRFPGIRPYPVDFVMKHYLVLSLDHAIQKYVDKDFDPKEAANLHGWRATAASADLLLPSASQMREFVADDQMDASDPLAEHLVVKR